MHRTMVSAWVLALGMCAAPLHGQVINTVAGTDWFFPLSSVPALSAPLGNPEGVAVDAQGNVYAADSNNNIVVRISRSGVLTVVAGNGTLGFSGDGGSATSASLNAPCGVAVDSAGNLYIADYGNYRVRLVSPAGVITTIAGNGAPSSSSDGTWATSAGMLAGSSIAVDSNGRVYLADFGTDSVRMLVPTGRAPSLTITLSHSAEFRVAQPAAAYAVKVTNTASAAPTSGTVTVTDILPDSLKLVSMSGSGWTCAANACTRADALAAGASYPAISVLVSVDPAAPSQAVNRVYVSGGGASTEGASDFTLIAPNAQLAAPVLVYPSNGMSNVAPNPTLTWNPSPGAYAYDVYLGPWGSTPLFAARTTATSYTPDTLYGGAIYYWKVVARDLAGTQSSTTWSFWTQQPPQPPEVYSVTNSASYQESGVNGLGSLRGPFSSYSATNWGRKPCSRPRDSLFPCSWEARPSALPWAARHFRRRFCTLPHTRWRRCFRPPFRWAMARCCCRTAPWRAGRCRSTSRARLSALSPSPKTGWAPGSSPIPITN